jgi:hypothetical protein
VGPRFEEIDAGIRGVAELRDKPAGTIRITATELAIDSILVPKLAKVLRDNVEMTVDCGLTNIVAELSKV